jgi:hypothetical protein
MTRINDGRVSFEDPKEHPGKFHPFFVGLPGATLEMLSNYVRSTQSSRRKVGSGEEAIHLMAESKYYSTLQKVYAAPNLAADI